MSNKKPKHHSVKATGSISSKSLDLFADGAVRKTLVTSDVGSWLTQLKKSNDENDVKSYFRLLSICRRIGDYSGAPIPKAWLRGEGRHEDRNIVAVGCDQIRLYGSLCHVDGQPALLLTKYDPAKKQNKADQSLLQATAKAVKNLEQ